MEETLKIGKDRLLTVPTPALDQAPVVFSTDAALEIYWWFIDRMNAGSKVQGWSDWEIGKPVAEMAGEPFGIGPDSFRTVPLAAKVKAPQKWTVRRAENAGCRDRVVSAAGFTRKYPMRWIPTTTAGKRWRSAS